MLASYPATSKPRGGFSYLEVQVAMLLFAIAISGIGPLAMVHSRHIRRFESRLPATQPRLLAPAPSEWERKLGTAAALVDRFTPRPIPPLLINDGAPGYSQTDLAERDWYLVNWNGFYQNDGRLNYCNDEGDTAVWNWENLLPGEYQVMVTWEPYWFLNDSAEYKVYEGSKQLASATVDQTREPRGPLLEGRRWQRLAKIKPKGNSLRLQLSDRGRYYNLVDAAWLVPVTNDLEVLSVSEDFKSQAASALIEVKENVR